MLPSMLRCACGVLMSLAGSSAAATPEPPAPNPADPVDYIAWINQAVGGDITDNAADDYLRVHKRLTEFEDEWGDTLTQPWSDNKAVADWLAANAEALAGFRAAAAKGRCFFRLEHPVASGDPRVDACMYMVQLPQLNAHRRAVRGLIADGYHAWAEGDRDRLWQNCLVALRAGHHLDDSPSVMGRLYGVTCEAMGYQALRSAFHLSEDRAALTARVLPELQAADPPARSFAEACLLEQVMSRDICQRIFLPGAKEGTWQVSQQTYRALTNLGVPGLERSDVQKMVDIGYEATLQEMEAYFAALNDWGEAPYQTAAARTEQLEQMVTNSKNPFIRTLVPTLTRLRIMVDRLTAERRATRLIAHLFAQQAKDGKFPRSLSRLDAPGLDELRTDPFSGKDFKYKRSGDTFTLYTVGENLKDDGGRHDRLWGAKTGGDFVFWPMPE